MEIPWGQWHYDGIVSAIINHCYPQRVMQAIINNYLFDQSQGAVSEEHQREFDDMQSCRAMAKQTARAILGIESDE